MPTNATARTKTDFHQIRGVRAQFFVRGEPKPQGSARAFVVDGRAIVTSDNYGLKWWRNAVAAALQTHWDGAPIEGAVHLSLYFQLLRPPSVSAKRRPEPTVKPDLDKLARGVLDALTGIAYRDDAQVTSMTVLKRYDLEMGVHVIVQDMSA